MGKDHAITWREAMARVEASEYGHGSMGWLLWLAVPGRPLPLSNRTWGHWAAKAARVGMRRRLVAMAAAKAREWAQLPPATEQRLVRFVVYLCAPFPDYPNLLQYLKPDLDGLVDAGWLVDDKPQWLPKVPEVVLERASSKAAQQVLMEVRLA